MKTINIQNKFNIALILLYCASLTLGQVPTFIGQLVQIPLKFSDILLVLLFLVNIREISIFKRLSPLLFSSQAALLFFPVTQLSVGLFYLLRLCGLLVLGRVLYVNRSIINKKNAINILLAIVFVIALCGWVQYLFIPDLRSLKTVGWDDHLYRLASTYIDPTFTGLFMVFGVLISLIHLKTTKKYYLGLFFCLTLLFTYSRSSYLALLVSLLLYYRRVIRMKHIVLGIGVILCLLYLLPRPEGEGVKLERIYSVVYKAENLQNGISLFSKSPVFGFGYNNICVASRLYPSSVERGVNSCSGFDNSLVTALVSFGGVGVLIIIHTLFNFFKAHPELQVAYPVLVALLVHGQFTNTLFYQFILGFVIIYLSSVVLKPKRRS